MNKVVTTVTLKEGLQAHTVGNNVTTTAKEGLQSNISNNISSICQNTSADVSTEGKEPENNLVLWMNPKTLKKLHGTRSWKPTMRFLGGAI